MPSRRKADCQADTHIHGNPSPLLLLQLPKYSSMQLSDASTIKQIIRAAYTSVPDGQVEEKRRRTAGRLLTLVSCRLPT